MTYCENLKACFIKKNFWQGNVLEDCEFVSDGCLILWKEHLNNGQLKRFTNRPKREFRLASVGVIKEIVSSLKNPVALNFLGWREDYPVNKKDWRAYACFSDGSNAYYTEANRVYWFQKNFKDCSFSLCEDKSSFGKPVFKVLVKSKKGDSIGTFIIFKEA